MRIKIIFSKKEDIILPLDYNYFIQAFIYSHLDKVLAEKLHKEGFKYEKRNFKLFTFSRFIGTYKIKNRYIYFKPPIGLIIASVITNILQNIAESMMKIKSAKIGENKLEIEGVEVFKNIDFNGNTLLFNTISPITVYSTLKKEDGSKKTYYYSPYEKEFSEMIKKNLIKKYVVINNKTLENFDFKIEPINNSVKEKVLKYKNTIIKGWMGKFRVSGNIELIKIGYDTGFGSKNSQGFGCVEVKN